MVSTERPRDPKTVVLEAELLASSAERVRTWLEHRALDENPSNWADTEAIERALLERHDPLVTLSLAKLSADVRVMAAIVAGPALESKAVRLAALMNEVVGKAYFCGMPEALLEQGHELEIFVSSLDEQEVLALFSNRTLSDDFLIDFFELNGPWQALDEVRQHAAIRALRRNPRMQARYDGPYDGHAEYTHNKVFVAAWSLSTRVPVTPQWAAYLGGLYEKLPAGIGFVADPLQFAARWVPEAADVDSVKHENESVEKGDLGVFARMRKGLARLSVTAASGADARRVLASNADPAVRAAFYLEAEMTVEDMKQADERDPLLSFDQMMWNPRVWRTKAQREQLHAMAWDSKRDPNSYMDPQNMFNARRAAYREQHPGWFKDEDEEAEPPDPEAQPMSNGAFSTVVEEVKSEIFISNDLARATHAAVLRLLTRTVWLGWGIAVVLAIVLLVRR